MPSLGSLIICERIIVDQQQRPTLISLFQQLTVVVPENQDVPKDMIAALPWSVFAEWYFTDEEMTSPYVMNIEVLMPDDSPSAVRGVTPIVEKAKDGLGTRVFVQVYGLPTAQIGCVTVNVWLESNAKRVTDVFPYRIKIGHTKEATNQMGGTLIPSLTQTKPA